MAKHPLVVGAEVWVPDGDSLVFGSGAYGAHSGFLAVSQQGRFRMGEGLPGAVRAARKALLWNELRERFLRAEVASSSDFHAALGFPWFREDRLVAVVALLLRRGADVVGSVEMWTLDEALGVLTFADGHYSGCPEFERTSRMAQFSTDVGLPGLARASARCEVLPDVRESSSFVRAAVAVRARLKLGLGIPLSSGGRVASVITMIAAESDPFVSEVSTFERQEDGDLRAVTLSSEPDAPSLPASYFSHLEPSVVSALATGVPVALADGDVLSERTIALILPQYGAGHVRSVTCIEF
jgi:hypothetical protein